MFKPSFHVGIVVQIVETVSCDNFARNALRPAQVAVGDNPTPFTDSAAGKEPASVDSSLLP